MNANSALAIYLGLAVVIVSVMVLLAGVFGPSKPSAAKVKPYECGVSEIQPTEARWPVRFALVAMLFLVFDVEGLFFYPWALLLRELKWDGVIAMSSFVVIGVGYLYARARGAFKWR